MPASTQRGSSVIYVADSVREFPADVQDWLGRKESCAVASPNVYDMLALLARGQRYAAIVVSIESVDWNEIEFFDHAARSAGGARIYVAGRLQQRSKLEAACKRGAELFDIQLLDEDLAPPVVTVAGSELRVSEPPPAEAEDVRPVPRFAESEPATPVPAAEPACPASSGQLPPRPRRIFPERTEWASTRPSRPSGDRFSDLRDGFLTDEPSVTESVVSEEAKRERGDSEKQSLVPDQEEESSPAVIPFPWAPSPDRPRRTPPQPEGEERVGGDVSSSDERAGRPLPGLDSGIRLTPEEIAALLGDSAGTDSSTRGSET